MVVVFIYPEAIVRSFFSAIAPAGVRLVPATGVESLPLRMHHMNTRTRLARSGERAD